MALALRLGMSLERLESEMTHAELVDWMAYFDLQQAPRQPAFVNRTTEAASAKAVIRFFDNFKRKATKT